MTLITPFEVIAKAPVSRDYPTTHLCVLLPQIEESFVRECLTKELYEYLISKKQNYPATVVDYELGGQYNQNTAVVLNGCTYVALSNGVTSNPITNTMDWQVFKKFGSNTAANELWDRYLSLILALKGYLSTVVPNTYKSTAGGLIVNDGDGTGNRSARKAEISDLKNHTLTEIERVTANMVAWLDENAESNSLPWTKTCSGGKCATPGRNARRWGFR